jgi:hypothetical protein
MAIGVLNPSDSAHTPSVRPTRVNTGVNQRRWFSNSMSTEVRDQDLNDILAQIRYAIDYYSVLDVEGDDSLLQKAIAVGASSLTGNLAQLQAIVGGASKVPYWTSGSAMGTFTATAYSRSLFAMTNQTQWRDALGITAIASDNVVAFGALAASANTLAYFTGPGTMALTNFTPAARGLLDDVDVIAMRATLLLGSAALHPDTDFSTPSDLALKANLASPSLTGVPLVPTAATANNTTQIASTAYVKANIAALTTANIGGLSLALAVKADLASPALSGVPTTPTSSTATNSTQIASTAYVKNNLISYAPLASPTFTGTPTAPTAFPAVNTTQIATTAFVANAVSDASGSYQPLDTNLTTLAGSTSFFLSLSDDANAPTARATLELGSAATHSDTDFASPLDLLAYAPLSSPALTGTPTAPTAANGTNSTQIASTAFVQNSLAVYAPLASPALTGTPTAPTATSGNNSTQIASTAFVVSAISDASGSYQPLDPELTALSDSSAFFLTLSDDADAATARGTLLLGTAATHPDTDFATPADIATRAPLASPALTGTPTSPTAAVGDNSTQIASTGFVFAATRQKLTADTTFYVRTDGSDSNTGLIDSAGGAFLTIQKAINLLAAAIDLNGHTATIKCADNLAGYEGASILTPINGPVILTGNTVTPGNCIINGVTGSCLFLTAAGCDISMQGFRLQSTANQILLNLAAPSKFAFIGLMEFGATVNSQILIQRSCVAQFQANYSIIGSCTGHLTTSFGGAVTYVNGLTVTLTGTPNFSLAFATTATSGIINFGSTVFSGAATGKRYIIHEIGRFFWNAISYVDWDVLLPGSINGEIRGQWFKQNPWRNLIVNPGGRLQNGPSGTVVDDAYGLHDRWYALTQTGAITPSTLVDVADGIPTMIHLVNTLGSLQRFAYAQIWEGKNCKHLRNRTVTIQFKARRDTTTTVRYAILEWTGTEDAVTSDVVNDWTSTVYTPGNFFIASNINVVGTGFVTPVAGGVTFVDGILKAIQLGGTFNNLILIVWVQGTVTALTGFVDFRAQLEEGGDYTRFEHRPVQVDLDMALRYRQRKTVQASNGDRHIPLAPKMRIAPFVTTDVGTPSSATTDGFELTHTAAATANIDANAEL